VTRKTSRPQRGITVALNISKADWSSVRERALAEGVTPESWVCAAVFWQLARPEQSPAGVLYDSHRRKARPFAQVGLCILCGRRVHVWNDGEGGDSKALGDGAATELRAADHGAVGDTLHICAVCERDEQERARAIAVAHAQYWQAESSTAS